MERPVEQEQKQLIWKSEPESMVSVTIGRTMATLLAARPKKLHHSISRLSPDSSIKSSLDSLDYSLWFLHKYVRDAAQRDGNLDEILVPIIQHSLKYKDSKHDNQPMILLNWLFQDEFLFQAVAMNLANIITRKDDRYIAFGWCTLVRGLMEYENVMDQYLFNGIKEKYSALLKMLCTCIPHLSCIARKGSILQDKFELPSRLSVAAADCLLTLTEGLTKKPMLSSRTKSLKSSESNPPVSLLASSIDERKISAVHKSSEVLNVGMEDLFWDYLQDLIYLVERLLAWSRKSRPLHAKGLEQVLKWLQEIQVHYGDLQEEASPAQILKTRALLLSSCWKHYGMLLHLEDKKFNKQYKELLDQYLSGIQYYTNNHVEGHAESKDGGIETRKFFVNCLCLLLGRFDGKQLECVLLDYGKQISHMLLSQVSMCGIFEVCVEMSRLILYSCGLCLNVDILVLLLHFGKLHCSDEDVIDGVVHIFKVIIFKTNNSSGSTVTDTNQMDSMVPLLLHLLDERDAAARAVVMLIAEYCSISTDGHCLEEVLKRLDSGNAIKRRNAFDVISELVHISKDSSHKAHHSTWQVIANHLLGCLEYGETAIQEQTPNLLPLIDPSFVLPALVHLVCLSEEKARPAAREALFRVLKHHNQKPEVICMMLDSLRNLSLDQADAEAGACMGKGGPLTVTQPYAILLPNFVAETKCFGCVLWTALTVFKFRNQVIYAVPIRSNFDCNRVLRLIPEWSKTVQDWNALIGPLIDKMFAEPSNATIVRFLSYINEQLAEAADVVLSRVVFQMKGQKG
ncbi:ARM repeat superfamily protein [Gossypium australe]|uniref:ARM repeat superfamily protein n=1 Tax=Gossypium australe TaxID=47621 RepID=A0A5B6V828_9ROSI|nr:ARM repeat superfamily protein [Gossypium australe]